MKPWPGSSSWDDQVELAELIQAVLKGEGHAVEAMHGGEAALERLGQVVYDLVVCDLQMPDVDGAAVARAVEQLAPPRPTLLLMTGYADGPTYGDFLQTTPAVVLNLLADNTCVLLLHTE